MSAEIKTTLLEAFSRRDHLASVFKCFLIPGCHRLSTLRLQALAPSPCTAPTTSRKCLVIITVMPMVVMPVLMVVMPVVMVVMPVMVVIIILIMTAAANKTAYYAADVPTRVRLLPAAPISVTHHVSQINALRAGPARKRDCCDCKGDPGGCR